MLATLAGAALIASYFATVIYVTTKQASCDDLAAGQRLAGDCRKTGGDQHSVAFVLLGLVVLAMTALALARRAQGAQAVIVIVGIVAFAIALLDDLPQSTRNGAIGIEFVQASAHKGAGLWLELGGGALAAAAGVGGIALGRRPVE